MPKSTREWAKRELASVDKNLYWVYYHLDKVIEKYEDAYPEVAEPLKLAQSMTIEIGSLINRTKQSF